MWESFSVALGFLTRLRIPGQAPMIYQDADVARSLAAYPAVGLLLGAIQAAVAWCGVSLAFSAPLTSLWVIGIGAWLTRGLHLDGLADVADGLGGSFEPATRLEIMKDSRVGAFGVLALVFGVSFKVFAVSELLAAHRWWEILLVPTLSRYTMVLCTYKIPYARAQGGVGRAFLEHVGRREIVWSSVWAAGCAFVLDRFWAPIMLSISVLAAVLFRKTAKRWIGGMTGDMLGAVNEMTEIILYHAAIGLAHGFGS